MVKPHVINHQVFICFNFPLTPMKKHMEIGSPWMWLIDFPHEMPKFPTKSSQIEGCYDKTI